MRFIHIATAWADGLDANFYPSDCERKFHAHSTSHKHNMHLF